MFRGAAVDARVWFPGLRRASPDGFAIRPALLHPDSRGEIRLRSADPREAMRIAYNFFALITFALFFGAGPALAWNEYIYLDQGVAIQFNFLPSPRR
jgi:choline dehydrogenase-like flavoprotein